MEDYIKPLRPLSENLLRSSLAMAVSKISERPEFLLDCKISNGLPIFRIAPDHSTLSPWNGIENWFIHLGIMAVRGGNLPLYRGVPLDACERVMMNGIDVLPTDSVIFANDLQKASEYGGNDQLIMILNPRGMRRSYMMLDEKSGPEVRAPVEREYGTNPIIWSEGIIFYSRLMETDRRRGTPYEVENGWYIPTDPFSVLSGVIMPVRRS